MTTGKTTALIRQTFVGKVMSLLLNMLSRSVITFLPRSNCLLISWLQSPSALILKPKERNLSTASILSPSITMKWWDWMPQCQFSLFKPSSPGVCSNLCPLSQWCHPAISSSILPFSSCLQSFPDSRSFPMSQLFVSGGQSVGISASASVLPMNIQDWFPLGLAGWISLQSKGL